MTAVQVAPAIHFELAAVNFVPNAGTGKSEDRSLEAKVIDAKHPLRLRHQRSEFLDSAE